VKLLQHVLGHFEFIPDVKVIVDGDFGPSTEKAVKAFQTWWGTLTVDGIAGPLTWTSLNS